MYFTTVSLEVQWSLTAQKYVPLVPSVIRYHTLTAPVSGSCDPSFWENRTVIPHNVTVPLEPNHDLWHGACNRSCVNTWNCPLHHNYQIDTGIGHGCTLRSRKLPVTSWWKEHKVVNNLYYHVLFGAWFVLARKIRLSYSVILTEVMIPSNPKQWPVGNSSPNQTVGIDQIKSAHHCLYEWKKTNNKSFAFWTNVKADALAELPTCNFASHYFAA